MKIKAKEFTEIMESSVVVDPEGNEYRWKYVRKSESYFWALFIPLPSGSYVVRAAYNHQGAPYVRSALCPKIWVDESNSLENFASYMINGNYDECGGYESICSSSNGDAANLVDIVNKYPKIDHFPIVVEVEAITFDDEFGDFEYNFNSFDEAAHSFVEVTKIYALDFEKFKR